jgi:hypothetical protein
MATLAEQLASVQAAIAAVESGVQSITNENGDTVVYPALRDLYAREERLQRQINFELNGRIKVAEF